MIEQARLAGAESLAHGDTGMHEKLHQARAVLSRKEGELERPWRNIASPNATAHG